MNRISPSIRAPTKINPTSNTTARRGEVLSVVKNLKILVISAPQIAKPNQHFSELQLRFYALKM